MSQRLITFAAMAMLFSGMCVVENSAIRARPMEPSGPGTSSVYALAGEFRAVFANLLWFKAEQYHHEYVARHADWAQDKELMGMLDVITALDPHFVEAYGVGTYIQKQAYHDNRRAMNYLLRAIELNPSAWELHNMAAIFYVRWFNDPVSALPHALKAVQCCNDDFYRRRGLRLVHTIRRILAERELALKAAPTHRH